MVTYVPIFGNFVCTDCGARGRNKKTIVHHKECRGSVWGGVFYGGEPDQPEQPEIHGDNYGDR